ncbi:MAG TPA: MBL fold metallo-hydrolase [Thermoanaerobaculia bacterium]|nr:MBL fold metallo-hydrolase [Thermoanaerobaculia bacterium]
MIVAPLGSGSAGNAYYFESDGTSILVDAGFGPRETRKRLEGVGRDIEQLKAIVLTHEHYDHIRGAERIARKYGIPIYLTRGTLDASTIDREETPLVVFFEQHDDHHRRAGRARPADHPRRGRSLLLRDRGARRHARRHRQRPGTRGRPGPAAFAEV